MAYKYESESCSNLWRFESIRARFESKADLDSILALKVATMTWWSVIFSIFFAKFFTIRIIRLKFYFKWYLTKKKVKKNVLKFLLEDQVFGFIFFFFFLCTSFSFFYSLSFIKYFMYTCSFCGILKKYLRTSLRNSTYVRFYAQKLKQVCKAKRKKKSPSWNWVSYPVKIFVIK